MSAWQGGPEHQGWQPPPPGHQLYPAAPPGWAGPPPEPTERPLAVRAGLGAFLAATILGILSSLVTFLNFDELVDDAIDQAVRDSSLTLGDQADARQLAETIVQVGAVVGLLVTAAHLLFIWFAWNGRHWARVVLWIVGGLGIVGGLVGSTAPTMGFLTGLGVFQLLLLIVGVVLLAQKPASEWYRAEKWRHSFPR